MLVKGRPRVAPARAPDLLVLLAAGVPKILLRCALLLIFEHESLNDVAALLVCTEFFAGEAMIVRAFRRCSSHILLIDMYTQFGLGVLSNTEMSALLSMLFLS